MLAAVSSESIVFSLSC